ncbi:MAG: hypothetical protein IKR86_09395 [Candidatus Methanomethylophilaceae archaeon]|nr:hypothetical protein [Candidatus Methanomethylophilaceae archaeon]
MTSSSSTHKEREIHTADGASECLPEEKPQRSGKTRPESLNVHQRLNLARETIRRRAFTKDLSNKQFSSVSIDAMRDAVQEAIIAAGLNLVLVDKEFSLTASGPTKTFMGTAKMRVVNVDDPEDYVEYWTESFANDNGDKGLSKWDTGLLKTAYKEIFQIGERGKDDIDSYSNEEMEAEAERIEAIRARRKAQAAKDPFFGSRQTQPSEEIAGLRRQVGAILTRGEPWASIIQGHKAERPFAEWDAETLRQVIAECEAVREGSE